MKLDLNIEIPQLITQKSGNSFNISHIIADILYVRCGKIKPIKAYEWAKTFAEKKPIEVDKSDLEEFQKFIEQDSMFIAVKAEILNAISSLKDKETKKETKNNKN